MFPDQFPIIFLPPVAEMDTDENLSTVVLLLLENFPHHNSLINSCRGTLLNELTGYIQDDAHFSFIFIVVLLLKKQLCICHNYKEVKVV